MGAWPAGCLLHRIMVSLILPRDFERRRFHVPHGDEGSRRFHLVDATNPFDPELLLSTSRSEQGKNERKH